MTEVDPPPRPNMRLRREPPPFRLVAVRRIEPVSPRLMRVTLAGPNLAGLRIEQPAASVRLLLPSPGSPGVVVPTWNGNEFLLPDGSRPVLRTFTPLHPDRGCLDEERHELDLDIVLHGSGLASTWAGSAQEGDEAALSGPGRGYEIDRDAPAFLLAGDESAIPAISQLLEALPPEAMVQVCVEIAHPDARVALPEHPHATVQWCDLAPGDPVGEALFCAVVAADLRPGMKVWVAGEAAAVQRIRNHLFVGRGLPRAQAVVRGYWKHGRSGQSETEA